MRAATRLSLTHAARWAGYDFAPLLARADSALRQTKPEGRDR